MSEKSIDQNYYELPISINTGERIVSLCVHRTDRGLDSFEGIKYSNLMWEWTSCPPYRFIVNCRLKGDAVFKEQTYLEHGVLKIVATFVRVDESP